jgi:hypothetical protein
MAAKCGETFENIGADFWSALDAEVRAAMIVDPGEL